MENWCRFFTRSVGVILLMDAITRCLMMNNAIILRLADPVLGIPLRWGIMIVAGIEFAIAAICLFGKRPGVQIGWLAWLMTSFIACHVALFCAHYHPQATSIGRLVDPLRLFHGPGRMIFSIFPLYLALGSYISLIALFASGHAGAEPAEAGPSLPSSCKMSCPICSGHLEFAAQDAGRAAPCPHCKMMITLQSQSTFKMACILCGGRIEFPADVAGQRIPCPHCAKMITLLGYLNYEQSINSR